MEISNSTQAERMARAIVREVGGDLNVAMEVALRRADDSARAWERWEDGQSAAILRDDTAILHALEAMVRA